MNEGLGWNAWFPVDREDDEMIVLAEPVFKILAEHGLSCEGPHRGRRVEDRFEIELTFCTEENAETARCLWLSYRHLGFA